MTVLFCDVVGSTALGESVDPEALQGLLVRYFERMKGIVESHGGSVEKFIGDAVMAVFGVPVVHEDDALRACRAAVEMREALPRAACRGADRRQHRRGTQRHRGTACDRRRGECGGAAGASGGAGRGADRRAHARARRRSGRGRRGAVARAEGQERAGCRPPAPCRPRSRGALPRLSLRRARAGAAAACGHLWTARWPAPAAS